MLKAVNSFPGVDHAARRRFQAIKARLLERKERAVALGVQQVQIATTAKIVDDVFSKKRPAQTGEAKSKKPKTSKPERALNRNNKPTSSAYSAKSSAEAGSAVVTEGQDLHACLMMMRKMSPTPKGLYLIRLGAYSQAMKLTATTLRRQRTQGLMRRIFTLA